MSDKYEFVLEMTYIVVAFLLLLSIALIPALATIFR